VRRNRVGNLPPIVPDVRDVLAALAPELACADVDRGHAEIRALANRDARIADNRRRSAQEAEEVLGEHVPEHVKVFGCSFSRKTRMPFDVPSEPASAFGQNQSTDWPKSLTA